MTHAALQLGDGLVESAGQLAVVAGMFVLVLAFVALGSFAYKALRGDGIEWPDDADDADEDGVQRGTDEDEWEFY